MPDSGYYQGGGSGNRWIANTLEQNPNMRGTSTDWGKLAKNVWGGLSNFLFGSGGTPPDLSFYEGWGKYPTEAVQRGEEAIRGESTRWLENAMRGIRAGASDRGLTTSSYGTELGDRAASEAVSRMAPALANLYQWGAGQQYAGDIQGKLAYLDMLKQYQSQQDQDGFINQILSFINPFD